MGRFTFMQIYLFCLNIWWRPRWVWCDFDGHHVCGVALLRQNKLRRYLTPPATSIPPTILLHFNPPTCNPILTLRISRQRQGHLRSKLIARIMEFLSKANNERSNSTAVFNNTLKVCVNYKQLNLNFAQFWICTFWLFDFAEIALKISQLSAGLIENCRCWFNGNTLAVVVYCGMAGWRKVLPLRVGLDNKLIFTLVYIIYNI